MKMMSVIAVTPREGAADEITDLIVKSRANDVFGLEVRRLEADGILSLIECGHDVKDEISILSTIAGVELEAAVTDRNSSLL